MTIRKLILLEKTLHEGALEKIEMVVTERIKRLKEVADKMPLSIELYKKVMKGHVLQRQQQLRREFFEQWSKIEEFLTDCLKKEGDPEKRDEFLDLIKQRIDEKGIDYLEIIKGTENYGATVGTEWLQGLVDEINNQIPKIIPSFRP